MVGTPPTHTHHPAAGEEWVAQRAGGGREEGSHHGGAREARTGATTVRFACSCRCHRSRAALPLLALEARRWPGWPLCIVHELYKHSILTVPDNPYVRATSQIGLVGIVLTLTSSVFTGTNAQLTRQTRTTPRSPGPPPLAGDAMLLWRLARVCRCTWPPTSPEPVGVDLDRTLRVPYLRLVLPASTFSGELLLPTPASQALLTADNNVGPPDPLWPLRCLLSA